jgi:hypothetical protein
LKFFKGADLLQPSGNPAVDLRNMIRNTMEEIIPNVITDRNSMDTISNTFVLISGFNVFNNDRQNRTFGSFFLFHFKSKLFGHKQPSLMTE